MCLEPPLRVDELPEEEEWYCKECRAERVYYYHQSDSLSLLTYSDHSTPSIAAERQQGAETHPSDIQANGQTDRG